MDLGVVDRPKARLADLIARRRPGNSLEQLFYADPRIFDIDTDRIFRRYWLYAGHSSRIPNRGDYFLCEMANESILIIRDQNLQIRALYNVCRHRGSRITTLPTGQIKSLVCPYHHWTYKLDGTLLAARHMPEDFDKSPYGLHRAHVRVVEGLIFVSLAESPPDFAPVERDITPHLRPQGLERAKVCHTRQYEVRANWKLIVENFRECYHCGPAHPEYCRIVGFASGIDSPRIAAENEAMTAEREAHWGKIGLETRHIDFTPSTWHLAIRFPLRKGFVSQSLDGQAVAPLMGTYTERDMGALAVVVYPTFWFEASSDYAVTMRFIPAGTTLTNVEMNWLVNQDAVEGVDYEVERVIAFWRATGEQDWKICEDNQAGVHSSRYEPGPYSPIESDVEVFIGWYLDQVSS